MIHPTAIVEAGAELGANCEIMAYAVVTKHVVLGDGVVVHPFAVIGGDPQYLKFDHASITGVRVGAGTVIREHVTMNPGTTGGGIRTVVGDDCLFMVGAHVAPAVPQFTAPPAAASADTVPREWPIRPA